MPYSKFHVQTLRRVILNVCVTNGREENVVKQHNLLEKMLYSNMKLHVSAYNGHHQVSVPIKGSLPMFIFWN